MKPLILFAGAACVFLIAPVSLTPSVINFCFAEEIPLPPPPPPIPTLPPSDMPGMEPREIADAKAEEYNVSADLIKDIIDCESRWVPNAVGDGGNSHGLVQIHLPSHPYVTKEEAYDPTFAIDFLAKHLSLGNGSMWTCYHTAISK